MIIDFKTCLLVADVKSYLKVPIGVRKKEV